MKMKRVRTTVLILVAILAVSTSAYGEGASLKFRAALSGAQEVPEVVTETTGEIRVRFNEARWTASWPEAL